MLNSLGLNRCDDKDSIGDSSKVMEELLLSIGIESKGKHGQDDGLIQPWERRSPIEDGQVAPQIRPWGVLHAPDREFPLPARRPVWATFHPLPLPMPALMGPLEGFPRERRHSREFRTK
jgi:hypothetical protein